MARGSNQRDGRASRSEFPGGSSDRGFASEGGSAGMPSPERIQAFYSPNRKEFTIGLKANVNEHRQFARSVLQDAFASSTYGELGLPDSQYAMDALDTMQKIAERWAASGKAPTIAQTTEFREIAKRAVQSMNDELNQEARALRAEYNRETGGGRAARSEWPVSPQALTQPDGSPSKFSKTRETLIRFKNNQPTISGITSPREFVQKILLSSMQGVDFRDLPDSQLQGRTIERLNKSFDKLIKSPSVTDEQISKWRKSVVRGGEAIIREARNNL